VVVDTGSEDGTPELVRSRGGRVVTFPWCDDFSAARNVALDHCRQDWVLVLDGDEALDPASGSLLRAATQDADAWALRLQIRNHLVTGLMTTLDAVPVAGGATGDLGGVFSHRADFPGLRFFRRAPWVRYQGRIHELVDPCFEARGLPIRTSEAVIHHYGKALLDREQHKRDYYLELARRDVADHPERKQAHFNLLQQALNAWDWPTALEAAEAYRRLADTGPSLVLLGGALALQELGRDPEALTWFAALLEGDPEHGVGMARMAVSLAKVGQQDQAVRLFEAVLERAPEYALPYVNYAEMEQARGHLEAARRVLERGLQRMPSEVGLWEARIRLEATAGTPDLAAQQAWRALQAVPRGGGGLWHRLVAASLARQGALPAARAVASLGLQAFPEVPELRQLLERLG